VTTTFRGPPLASAEGIGALTMRAFLEEVAGRFGPNEALVFDDPLTGSTTRWDYAQLLDEARRIGRGLVATGVRPGQAVGILMGNRPEAVAALFGAALAGAVAVPMSTFAPKPELSFMLREARVVAALTQRALLDRRFGEDLDELGVARVAVFGTPSWEQLLAAGDRGDLDAIAASARPDDDGLVIFSSGTTTNPKGILHSHRAVTLQFWIQAGLFGRDERTRMWTALPMFWTAGLNSAMGATLAAGGCWVMQETFEPGAALALMEREEVTEPYSLPHQTSALVEHPSWATTDLSSLRCVFGKGAFARHPTVHGDPSWLMPVGYGLSETCAFFAAHPSDADREDTKRSMGRLLPGNELRVVDPESGAVLDAGQVGELAIKGPTLMRRYLGTEPAQCFDPDGFFRTGDLGWVDADGFVHFEGRRTEMIKTGGANVSPAELEVQLRACAPVKLSRIIGVPDERLDQVVVACIVLKEGSGATEDDIRSFLRERVAAYKVPKRVLFFDDGEIPMTDSATKVRDEALRAAVHARLERNGDR
jgi:fatty-acyl-CoA synthase